MRAALRPYVTAGVALVGASVITIAPIAATPPDVKIANPAVQLAASPFDPYVTALVRARNNIEVLFLQALADPATPFTLEDVLDGLLVDPAANFQEFVDGIEGLGPFLQLNLPALLGDAADNVQSAFDRAAEGNIDLFVVDLILAYLSLTPIVAEAISIPLPLLGPDLELVTTFVLAKTLNAAIGPVISGIGKTAVAIQNIVNVLNEDPDPGALLGALIGAPGTIADGALNGFPIVPSPIAFPGILTPGNVLDPTEPDPFDPTAATPGPVSLAIGLAQGVRALLTPEPEAMTIFTAPDGNERIMTFDVNANQNLQPGPPSGGSGPVVGQSPLTLDPKETDDPDQGNLIMSEKETNGGTDLSDGNKHRPRLFGRNSDGDIGGGAGLSTLREGIRDGIQGFREGVRDTVKTFTGRGGDDGESTSADTTNEAP